MLEITNPAKTEAAHFKEAGETLRPSMKEKLAGVAWALSAMFLYYLAARTGMQLFALKPSNITLLWLASGIGMVMCVRHGLLAVPMIITASFCANYPGMAEANLGMPALYTLVSASADGAAGLIAMLMMRIYLRDGLNQSTDLLPFGLKVCLMPTVVSSIVISLNLVVGGYIHWDEAGNFVRMLVLADSLGILLIYPLYVAWSRDSHVKDGELGRALWTGLGIVVLLGLAFCGYPGFIYFILPLLLLSAFYISLNLTTLILTISMVAIIAMTGQQLGPFQSANLVEANFMLVSFVCTTTFTILGIALHNNQLQATEVARRDWQKAAEADSLTSLNNRAGFLPLLEEAHQQARRTGRPYALALLDVDYFKSVNDIYGHQAGDEVLTYFSGLMQANIRGIDRAARLGGDEFFILFPGANALDASYAMERLRSKLEQYPVKTSRANIFVTSSIGIAEYSGGHATPDMVRAMADQLLYSAKHAGRNCIMFDSSKREGEQA